MRLHLDRAGVSRLLEHNRVAPAHKVAYYRDKFAALWLVDSQGLYLMSNGDPGLTRDDYEQRTTSMLADPSDKWISLSNLLKTERRWRNSRRD